ncbi:hypothetical protein ONS95_004047 [Cadophora gregata]|uniref:uncharacterized protein n=1 Tax=Cadophora gregata TaxID=51156 RepID=UPI0026DD6565|nr:uncharacterized protein ONS95_004047 [Cadophora gregata]KAK0107354.1 hypothetical protein ONS95_004047 [Cadophora gregata]
MAGWKQATVLASKGVGQGGGPGYGTASEPVAWRDRDEDRDRYLETGARLQVLDGREERINAQGFRLRENHMIGDSSLTGAELKEKRSGWKKFVGGMGYRTGGARNDEVKKQSLKAVVDVTMEKEKEKAQRERDKEEAYAQAALKWAERERELQAQGHTLPGIQSPVQSLSQTTTSRREMETTPVRSSRVGNFQAVSGSIEYRPPARTLTQISCTEPGEGEKERQTVDRERGAGGSLDRIRGVGKWGNVGRSREEDGDTATILTTWSMVLPRKLAVSQGSGHSKGVSAGNTTQTVVKIPEETQP